MIKLLKRLKPFTGSIVMIIFFIFIQTITELLLPTLMSDIVDQGIIKEDITYIVRIGLIMLGVTLVGGLCTVVSSFMSSKVAVGFAKKIRGQVFKKVTSYSLHEIDEIGTASLITRTTNDITQIQNVVIMILRFFTRAPLMAVGSIIMALSKDGPLTWVIVVAVILMGIFIGLLLTKAIPLFKIIQTKVDNLNRVMRERLTGIRVIRAFNKIDDEKERFEVANKDLTDVSIRVNKIMALGMPAIMFLFSVTTLAIVWFGANRINIGALEVGDMMAFIQYATQIMFSVMMLTMVFIMVPRASASATRVNDVLEVIPEINDPTNPVEAKQKRGLLEFRDVTFSYYSDHGAEEPALCHISFTSKPGEITAIIGGTGSGKSTMLNLIPRFYDIDSGEILVNDVNIKDMTMKALRNKISYVPQKALLFSGTVEENIKFGNEGATKEAVMKVADIAQASEFINEMELGFESSISQGGTNVSGGQKQRLSIARALARPSEIYLFDDSFSALDLKTESKLRSSLKNVMKDSTVLVVAQKITSVMDANQIIVLDNGKIVGKGTHAELSKDNAVYKEIIASQLSKEEIA
jgi:ATP-binding cassette subfamily B protein